VPRKREKSQEDPATQAFRAGVAALMQHPLFVPLLMRSNLVRHKDSAFNRCPPDGWAVVTRRGNIHLHPKRRASPEEWSWVIAHALLHLGFGHFQKRARPDLWNIACDLFVNRFLADLKLGRRPAEIEQPGQIPSGVPTTSENAL
jgi:hypothetical protein